jgi:ribonuclease E
MDKVMLITEHGDRDQIAVVEGRELVEHYVTRVGARSMVGNIYLGRVQNVLPGMEAAFVDVGRGRNAVLYAGEVSFDEEVEEEGRRIEQVLKPGQGVLVQVTKDPMGGKGARLTGQVSLPGRYLVYVADGGASGISRRLPEKERARLRDVVKRIRPSGAGVIVRTAAEGASEEELAADLERLKKGWDSIKRRLAGPSRRRSCTSNRSSRFGSSETSFRRWSTGSWSRTRRTSTNGSPSTSARSPPTCSSGFASTKDRFP